MVELVQLEAEQRGVEVNAVQFKLGAPSGVVRESLLFSYEIAGNDTPLQGSRLVIEDVPVVIFCPHCQLPPRPGRAWENTWHSWLRDWAELRPATTVSRFIFDR